jgi:hypothetical protein
MILTVNRNICQHCFDLREFGCDCQTQVVRYQDVHMIVRRAGLGTLQCENYFADMGCGQWIGPKKRNVRVQPPGIKYPAFRMNDDGQVCFLWDSKFLEAEPGRWNGKLYVCNELVGEVKFQVGSRFQMGGVTCIEPDVCPVTSACPTSPVCP